MKKTLMTAFLAVSICGHGFSMEGGAAPFTPVRGHEGTGAGGDMISPRTPVKKVTMSSKPSLAKEIIGSLKGRLKAGKEIVVLEDTFFKNQKDFPDTETKVKNYDERLQKALSKGRYGDMAAAIATGFGCGGLDYFPMDSEKEVFFLTNVLSVVRGLQDGTENQTEDLGQKALKYFLHPFLFTQDFSLDDWAHMFVCAAIASAAAHQFKSRAFNKDNAHVFERFRKYVLGEDPTLGRKINPLEVYVGGGIRGLETYTFASLFHIAKGISFDDFLVRYKIEEQFNSYWDVVRSQNLLQRIMSAMPK
jgi:hypothetical protein